MAAKPAPFRFQLNVSHQGVRQGRRHRWFEAVVVITQPAQCLLWDARVEDSTSEPTLQTCLYMLRDRTLLPELRQKLIERRDAIPPGRSQQRVGVVRVPDHPWVVIQTKSASQHALLEAVNVCFRRGAQ